MTDWNEALKTAKEGGLFIDDTERKLRASIEQSIGSTPQEEASISRLSKEMNLPRDTVQRNRAEVDNSNKYKKLDIKSILESSPQTAKYLSDPDKAKVASKDIENLSSLERGFFNNAARRVGERTTELAGQFLSFIDQSAEALNQATGIDDALGGIVFDGALPKWVGPEEFSKIMENGGNLIENASQSLKDADFGARYIHTVESVKQAFSDPDTGTLSAIGEVFLFAGEQGIASIPDMIAVVANLPGYVAARSAEIGETRAEFKGQEQTIKETLEAAPFAIGSALLERIMPTNALQNLSRESVEMVGKEVLKEAVKQGSIEGATEFIQEGAIEYVGERIGTGAEMDVAEALERGAFGALAGGPTGAVIGGTSVGARAVADRFSDARIKGNSEQAQLAAIFDSAGKSLQNPDGLINVDPESFRELVRSQLEQSELSDIHISASAMTEILNQSDIDQETLGKPAFKSIEDQMLEASSVDGDIVIPIEDVLTDIMPNEQVFDSMKQWMRLSSSSMVDPEVEAETEAFQQKFQDIMAEAEENVDFKAMGLDVYNRVMEQAIASNVMPDVARKSAAVYQAAFETIGKRSGLTAEQFVERYNFGIQGSSGVAVGEDVLSQARESGYEGSDLSESREWLAAVDKFGSEGMTKEARLARAQEMGFDTETIYYHGTDKDFSEFKVGQSSKRYTSFTESDVISQGVFVTPSSSDAETYGDIVKELLVNKGRQLKSPLTEKISSKSTDEEIKEHKKIWDDIEYIFQPAMYERSGKTFIDTNNGISNVEVDEDGKWIDSVMPEGFVDWDHLDNPEVVNRIRERGYDSVNVDEPNDESGESLFILNPSQIRSVNAAFDPDFSDSADLLAQPAYKDASAIYDEVRKSFLDVLPEDADVDEVFDYLDEFSPEQQQFIKALDRDDWLGFDYPSQAISALMSGNEDIAAYDLSMGTKQALGRLVNSGFKQGETAASTSAQEINGGVSAEDFTSAITDALASNKNAASADIYPAEDYERHNLYLLDDGKAGFAITPDGTLISVFKSPDSKIKGAIDAMIPIAVQEGATRLEAFDGFLTEAYGRNGFVETERYEWDENFKPENWREEDGTPDLVVMEFDNEQYESVTSKTNPETLQELRGVRREDGAVQQPESGNRRRRNPGGGYTPLEGSPVIEGATGPDPELVSVAERYAQAAGIDLKPQSEYVEVDPERAARIAEAYDQMEHAPSDPAVKAAYRDLIDQTMAQYEALIDAGYQFYFMDPANDPYQGNPWNAMRDLRKNKVMAVYPTSDGFGSSDLDVSENPLLEDTGLKWSFGSVDGEQQTVYANDLFRAVHDAFGHGLEGAGFRARGEENAWQAHVRLFTGDAVKAITSETRGQNSWLNYGPYGEQNQTAKVEDTVFADQKTGLLPDWVFTEGLAGDAEVEGNTLFQSAVKLRSGKETLKKYGLDPGKRHNTRDVAAALEARQREKAGKISKTDRSPEAVSKIARWMTEEVMFELEHPEKSGAGWYSYKFQRALDKFAEAFPELETDQSARDLMTALIAITSDGQKVVPNFAMAADYYKNFKETGTLSSSRGHQRQSSINNNVAVIQSMLESMGPEAMKDYLLQERTVSELKKIAKESGIEFSTAYKADVKMPLAAIVFGPKLGAFYANLMGAHGYLTMDRWWTRTFNRYRGTLLPKPTQQGLERFKGMLGDPEMSDDQALSETVQYKKSYEAKNYKNGTAIEKAANTIYKAAFESIEDAPFNASDRSFMLEVVERTKKNLKRRGQDISIADIQAILWYYEKRLYGDLGARQTADISYEEAAERVTGDILSNRSSGSDASGIPETAREGSQEVSEVSQGIGEEDFLSLRQSTEDNGTRGGIRFGLEDRFAQIMLDQKADSSTLMHEGAHLFLEIYSDLVMQVNPPKEIEADFNNIMSWLGVDPVLWPDMSIDQKREYHERFAETFEQYMFEGKAPSPDLIPVFSAFKRWLKQLYQNIKALLPNAQINDQIRGVFDRMLATDDQIAQAEAINGYKPLFDNPAEAGMTEDEYKAYRERTSKASQKAEQTLLEKAIKQVRSLKTEWWREESEKLRPATESRLKSQRVYVAADHLKNADIKIDQAEMKEILGVEKIPKKLYGMSQKGGASPELVAQQLGYGSASEMLQDVQNSPTLSEAVKEDVERQMKERHGDILNDGTIEDEAQLAVHNPERGEAIMAEVRALTKKAGTRTGVDRKALQKRAKQVIGEKVIADIKPASYHRAEVKAAAAAAAAKAKGNDADALKFKEQQAWAFYLYKEARAAKEIEAKGAKYARSLMRGGKLKKLQAAGDSYLEQAQSILGRYEFVRVSEKRLQERRSMRDWLNSILGQAHEGSPVPNHENLTEEQRQIAIEEAQQDSMGALPDVDMLDKYGVTNYREMTLDDFTGVIDALKMIDHMAGVENRLLTQSEKKKLDEWITELVETITENAQGGESARLGSNRSKSKRIAQSLKEFKDIARTPTSIVSMLDGFKDNGTAWNLIVRPLQDAAAMETENLNQASQRLKEIFGRYSSKELRSLNKNIYDTQIESNLTKHDVVSILLNWGNSQNKQRVLDGFNITEAEANYLMETYLEQKDYEFVKDVWAYLETFKKDAFDLHRDLFGFTPAEVEAEPFETRFGTMPGGYYPIKYDPVRSAAAEQHLAEKQSEAFVKSIKSRNKLGSNQARAATVKRAINTDMSQVIFGHINDVIHQTTHDRALYDVGRILANDRVKAAINEHQGEQFYKSLTSMVRNIKDGTEPTKDIMDRVVQVVRNNATLAMLGASLRTIVLQPFGITNSIAQARMSGLGASGLINGYARYMKDPASNAGMIREKSLYMKNREQTQSVAISRIKNKIRDGSRVDVIRESVMIPMMKVQFYSVDAPLWMATYEKALQSMDEDAAIKTADQAVRAAQGGGNIVDTAEAMMGGPFRKLFTNFLTYSVTTYNLQAQNFRRTFKLGEQGVFDFAVNTFVLMTMPAILTAMLNDWIAGDDDDEDLAERIAREQASFLMSVNPLTAQFSGAATGFDYSGPQGSAIISKTLQLSTQVGQGEADDAAIKSGIWVAGLLTGLPAAQINRTVFGIKGAMEDNESAGTTIKQALFGPER